MKPNLMYELRGVRKTLSPDFTLRVGDLSVPRGETLGLLGPTGAGKSTLLKLLAGIETPSEGEVQFDQQRFEPRRLPLATRRRLAMVHQRPALLAGNVTVNVEYGLRLRRDPQRAAKGTAMLAKLGLEPLASQDSQTLSGGQAQLVALGRALVIEPDVLLLDEPTAHLDPAHVALVERLICEYQQGCGGTVVWATHNLFQARRVAARTALLLNGRLVEVAPTHDFFERPQDPRTADFVQGRMVY